MTTSEIHSPQSNSILAVDAGLTHTASMPTSTPSSPTSLSKPTTPELHDGRPPGLDIDPTIIAAMNTFDKHDEFDFPNPYEHLPPTPQQRRPQRLPSVLRPAHPKSFDSLGSRRASMALSGFESPGLSPFLYEDGQLGPRSSSLDQDDTVQHRRNSAVSRRSQRPPPIILRDEDGAALEETDEPEQDVQIETEELEQDAQIETSKQVKAPSSDELPVGSSEELSMGPPQDWPVDPSVGHWPSALPIGRQPEGPQIRRPEERRTASYLEELQIERWPEDPRIGWQPDGRTIEEQLRFTETKVPSEAKKGRRWKFWSRSGRKTGVHA